MKVAIFGGVRHGDVVDCKPCRHLATRKELYEIKQFLLDDSLYMLAVQANHNFTIDDVKKFVIDYDIKPHKQINAS